MAVPDYADLIADAADQSGVPVDVLTRLVGRESSGNPRAVSPVGAIGLGQLMPGTAAELGVDPTDPAQNVHGSARYLRQQYDRFGDWTTAAAAYNAGPAKVQRSLDRTGDIPSYTRGYAQHVAGGAGDGTLYGGDGGSSGKPDTMPSDADLSRSFAQAQQAGAVAVNPASLPTPATAASGAQGADTGLPNGVRPDPRDPRIKRNPDGSIYGIGEFGGGGRQVAGGPIEIDISGSTSPDSIAGYLKAHPDMQAAPEGWGGPSSAMPSDDDLTASLEKQIGPLNVDPGSAPLTPAQQAARLAASKNVIPDWLVPAQDFASSATMGLGEAIPSLAAMGGTALRNTIARAKGETPAYGAAEMYDAQRQAMHGQDVAFAKAHPNIEKVLGIGGMFALPIGELSFLAKGAPAAASAVRGLPGVGSTLSRLLASTSVGAKVARSVPVGLGLGAIAGGANAPTLGQLVPDAGNGALLGAAFAPAAEVGGTVLASGARSTLQRLLPQKVTQEALSAARQRLAAVGLNFNELSQTAQTQVRTAVAKGRDPGDAAIAAAASDLPVSVPISRGQTTGLPTEQWRENAALRGANGPQAAETMRSFQGDQQQALRSNVDAIAGGMTGGRSPEPGQGGERVSAALNSLRDAKKGAVDSAYEAARTASPTTLPVYDAQALAGRVRQATADFDPLNVPRVAREMDRLDAVTSGDKDPDLRGLFDARRRLSQLRAGGPGADPVEQAAAGRAVKAFDDGMSSALSDDLFRGDPASVQKWRDAIGQRREFGQLFQGGDLIEKLTQRAPRGGALELKVDPHDASNYILGRSGVGFVGRANLYRDLGALRDRLGANSDDWNALRAEAFQRFADKGEGAYDGGQRQFSGVKFAKAWGDAKDADPALLETLFTPAERVTIDKLAAISSRVTSPVKGGDNPSNSAVAFKALLQRLPFAASLKLVGPAAIAVDHGAQALFKGLEARAIRHAVQQPRARMAPVVSGRVAALLGPSLGLTSGEQARRGR